RRNCPAVGQHSVSGDGKTAATRADCGNLLGNGDRIAGERLCTGVELMGDQGRAAHVKQPIRWGKHTGTPGRQTFSLLAIQGNGVKASLVSGFRSRRSVDRVQEGTAVGQEAGKVLGSTGTHSCDGFAAGRGDLVKPPGPFAAREQDYSARA